MDPLLLFLLIGLAVLFVVWLVNANAPPKEPTLYERLGGVFVIAKVVDVFSDALITNPVVGRGSPNKFLNEWSTNQVTTRLPGLKFMRTLWLCSVSGGPFVYSPTRRGRCPFGLEKAHAGLHITSAEFDEVARVLAQTLDSFSVPAKEKGEVLAAFAAHKNEVIGVSDGTC